MSFVARLLCLAVLLAGFTTPAPGEALSAPEVTVAQLPKEAAHTLVLIKAGGPFPYRRDGTVFANRERLLPARSHGHYREYTVPTPDSKDRGARRIVAGRSAEYYYTDDHYRSFRRIRE